MNWQYTFEIRDPFLAELLVFNLTLQLHVIKTSDLSVQVNRLCVVLILCRWHLSNYVARKQYSLVSCLLSEEEIPLGQSLVRYCKYCCSSLLSILQLLDLEPQSPLSAFPQIRRPQSTWPFPACIHARLTGVTQRFVCLFSWLPAATKPFDCLSSDQTFELFFGLRGLLANGIIVVLSDSKGQPLNVNLLSNSFVKGWTWLQRHIGSDVQNRIGTARWPRTHTGSRLYMQLGIQSEQ